MMPYLSTDDAEKAKIVNAFSDVIDALRLPVSLSEQREYAGKARRILFAFNDLPVTDAQGRSAVLANMLAIKTEIDQKRAESEKRIVEYERMKSQESALESEVADRKKAIERLRESAAIQRQTESIARYERRKAVERAEAERKAREESRQAQIAKAEAEGLMIANSADEAEVYQSFGFAVFRADKLN